MQSWAAYCRIAHTHGAFFGTAALATFAEVTTGQGLFAPASLPSALAFLWLPKAIANVRFREDILRRGRIKYLTKNNFIFLSEILEHVFDVVDQMRPAFIGI